jgi:hypothetical protein
MAHISSQNPQGCEQSGIITYAAINAISAHPDIEKVGEEAFIRASIDHIRQCAVCQAYMNLILSDPTAKLDPRFREAFTSDPVSSPAEQADQ